MSLEFVEYSNASGFSTPAHVVTDETSGMYVLSTSSQEQFVGSGNVLVPGSRPDVYDVVSAADWEKMGMSTGAAPTNVEADSADSVDDDFEIGGKSDG
jgi:hypothetical protein